MLRAPAYVNASWPGLVVGVAAMLGMVFVPAAAGLPAAPPQTTGCSELSDPAAAARCEAQGAVKREVERAAKDQASRAGDAAKGSLDRKWRDAVEEADGPHLDEVARPRVVALVGGLVWLLLLARMRKRRQAV